MRLKVIFIFVLGFIACKEVQKENELKTYGAYLMTVEKNSEVVLNLSSFKHFENLITHIDYLVCNNSVPQISIQKNNIHKVINLGNICFENYGCVLIKQRNVIEIHNDTIFKQDKPYPLNNLKSIMQRDYLNNGKLDAYCSDPEKFLIQISYDDTFDNLEEVLHVITEAYDNIQPEVSLKIWLVNHVLELIPPPPAPEFVDF